jgi:hypothetical protein
MDVVRRRREAREHALHLLGVDALEGARAVVAEQLELDAAHPLGARLLAAQQVLDEERHRSLRHRVGQKREAFAACFM